MSWYSHQNGAGVFAAGSMQWNWGLDNLGPWGDRMNPAVQQMSRNVLNRFCSRKERCHVQRYQNTFPELEPAV